MNHDALRIGNLVAFALVAIAMLAIIMILAKPHRSAEDEQRRRCALAGGTPVKIHGDMHCLRRDSIIDLRKLT